MSLFWAQRLKHDDQDAAWAISYADMMTLLLAVFVMIAAMAELNTGSRFASVRNSVRAALGFEVELPSSLRRVNRTPTLVEQFARAGFIVPAAQVQDEALRCCDVSHESDRLVVRIAGKASFDRLSAVLKPEGRTAIERIASLLRPGKARIEVRGYNGDAPADGSAQKPDAIDLSFARARAVVDTLTSGGVEPERIFVTACGDQNPLTASTSDGPLAAANRRIEILVHADNAVQETTQQFAEKGRHENAR